MSQDHHISATLFKPTAANNTPAVSPINSTTVLPQTELHTNKPIKLTEINRSVLGQSKPFIIYDLELSAEEQRSLDQLKISTISHYENYGDFDIMFEEIKAYISSLGDGNLAIAETITKAIIRLIQKVLEFTCQETAWITLRAFVPVPNFKEPRWHADRYDYPPTGEQLKAAITIKGPSTLFYDVPFEKRECLEDIRTDKDKLEQVIDKKCVVSAPTGQGAIFTIGASHAPIHSEPHITSERLFLAVVPANKQQIDTLYKQTPEHEIISLLIKHGLYCYFVGPRLKDKFQTTPYEDTEIIVFKLLNDNDINVIDLISRIIKSHNNDMKIEVVPNERSLIKVTFPYGAAIKINDLSWFFKEHLKSISNDEDIFAVLNKYASNLSHDNQTAVKAAESSEATRRNYSLRFNTFLAKNTCGLFKPKSQNVETTNSCHSEHQAVPAKKGL